MCVCVCVCVRTYDESGSLCMPRPHPVTMGAKRCVTDKPECVGTQGSTRAFCTYPFSVVLISSTTAIKSDHGSSANVGRVHFSVLRGGGDVS